jgi:hypothetical protein
MRRFVYYVQTLSSINLERLTQLIDEAGIRRTSIYSGLGPLLFLLFRKVVTFPDVNADFLTTISDKLTQLASEATFDENVIPLQQLFKVNCDLSALIPTSVLVKINSKLEDLLASADDNQDRRIPYAPFLRYQLPHDTTDTSLDLWIALFYDDIILNGSTERPDSFHYPNYIRILNKSLNKDILLRLGFSTLDKLSKMPCKPRNPDPPSTLLKVLARIPTKTLLILLHSPKRIIETLNSSPSLQLLATSTLDGRTTKALSGFTIEELDKLASSTIKISDGEISLFRLFTMTLWDNSVTYYKIEKLCHLFLHSSDKIDIEVVPQIQKGNVPLRLLQNYLPQPKLLRYTNTELAFFKRQKEEAKVKRIAREVGTDYLQAIEDNTDLTDSENIKNSDAMNI